MAKKKADYQRLVERLIDSTARVPDTVELASHLMDAFGGAQALAQEVFKTYQAAANSPMIRGRILNDVTHIMARASEKAAASQGSSLKNLSREDLEALVQKLLERKGASEEARPEASEGPEVEAA